VIPFLGLPIGFLLGLYIAESLRLQDWRRGASSAVVAIKALGTGILIEFSLAMLSTITFALAVVVRFVTACTPSPPPPVPPGPTPPARSATPPAPRPSGP